MRYASATAFRAALETRLNAARTDAVGISRLRKRVVFERLLARLNDTAPGAWVLKGGFALELRLGAHARTTKDIDVDFVPDEEQAVEMLIDAARLDLDDGFEFAVERTSSDADPGGGQRWSVTANVAGRLFERAAIDLDFATGPILDPQTIVSSELLTFADLEPVRVPALASSSTSPRSSTRTRAPTRASGRAPASRTSSISWSSRTRQSSTPNAWMTRSTRSSAGGRHTRVPPPCLRPRRTGPQHGDSL